MRRERIRKRPRDFAGATLWDCEDLAATYSWAKARSLLDGLPGGALNIAHETADRHVIAGRGDKLALRWIGRDDRIRDFNHAELRAQTSRFANSLKALITLPASRSIGIWTMCSGARPTPSG
jgi:acetyl-CoA synthetase